MIFLYRYVKQLNEENILLTEWLNYCKNKHILPWKYDLKSEIYCKIDFNDEPVKRLLKSWAGMYFSKLYQRNKKHADIEVEDCDLMQCIYKVLWGKVTKNASKSVRKSHETSLVEADIMNSFFSPYKKILKKEGLRTWQSQFYCGKKGDYQKNAGDMHELLSHYYEKPYIEINNRFCDFAELTHTIGNCTLVPLGFNKHGHQDKKRSWSEALCKCNMGKFDLESLFSGLQNQNENSHNIEDYRKVFLMNGYYSREDTFSYGDTDYLERVTAAIEKRGIEMTFKLCEKIGFCNVWRNYKQSV